MSKKLIFLKKPKQGEDANSFSLRVVKELSLNLFRNLPPEEQKIVLDKIQEKNHVNKKYENFYKSNKNSESN